MKNLNFVWLHAAAIRAIRTMAQTALGMFTIGAAINEINWLHILSVSAVAAVYSLLTSLSTSLPELSTDGELVVEAYGEKETYRFNFDGNLQDISEKDTVTFKVVKDPSHVSTSQE